MIRLTGQSIPEGTCFLGAAVGTYIEKIESSPVGRHTYKAQTRLGIKEDGHWSPGAARLNGRLLTILVWEGDSRSLLVDERMGSHGIESVRDEANISRF
jgi:hypothetical protein